MKRFLIPLLALLLLCLSLTAAAAEDQITLDVNTAKLPLYTADDPYIARLRGTDEQPGDGLQVLVLPVRRGLQIQTAVKPATVKNKRVTLTVDQPDLIGRRAGGREGSVDRALRLLLGHAVEVKGEVGGEHGVKVPYLN